MLTITNHRGIGVVIVRELNGTEVTRLTLADGYNRRAVNTAIRGAGLELASPWALNPHRGNTEHAYAVKA